MRRRPVGARPTAASDAVGRSSALSWEDLQWLREATRLPVLLKGVLSAEDAVRACGAGCAGLIVSNHGGRQCDGVPAAVDVLAGIARAVRGWERDSRRVRGSVALLVDGGVRRGSDVFKALALGADAVLIGRPVVWGLAYAGEEGVRQVLALLRHELELCMALAGCPSLAAITARSVTTAAAMRPRL